jgi:glycosyltransferase involved in cell wall biosynthesis
VTKFSIVTNAFNQGAFLRRAAQSVLRQEGVEIEYIIVDPGSTDGTAEVVKEFEGRAIIIRTPDGGPADGLNKAFAVASGDCFGYLNADDVYLPGALLAARQAFDDHRDAAAVYASGYVADAAGRISRTVRSTPLGLMRYTLGAALVLQQSTFYSRWAYEAAGGFNAANQTSWDLEILLDMLAQGLPVIQVDGYWSIFTIHPASITGSQRLAAASKANHQRLFQRIRGREMRPFDRNLQRLGNVYAKLSDPLALWHYLSDGRRAMPRFPNLELPR